ncbi:MAG: GAF domain-containing protein, partial [Cyanobacteria bacterium J06623_5]
SAIEREAARKERELAAQVRAAELEAHNQALAERDRILEATAAAANVMLTAADFSSAVGEAIALVGEGLAVDRVALLQHFEATEEGAFGYHEGMYEWADSGVSLQIEHPELSRISDDDAEFLDELLQGKVAGGVVDELSEPFRSGQIEMGVKSTYAVPIMVEGRYWGVIGFDDCQHETRRSESELEALMTLANCMGSAVEQERNRQAREAAERRMLVEREQAAQARAQQLQESNEVLELRDRWLSATAEATEELLSANELAQAIQPALKTIGETIGVDRIGIMYISEQDCQKVFLFLDEWTHPSQPIQSEHEKLFSVPASIVGEEYLKALLRGDPCGGDIEDFPDPFRSSQKEIGVQSTYAVPIVMDGQFWGLIGIDHCREKKLLTDTEIAVFQTIASCFASAIQRDEIRKAREAAEREAIVERERAARATELEAANKVLTTRDRWLQTTATAANELLSATDTTASVQKVLATIGDNLECDRISVMQYISDTPAHELGLMRMLYEWDAEGISVQSDDAELKDIPADGIEDWFRQILAGQWVGGIVNELDEPFRSGQQALGVQSTYAVPVFVEGELWGIVAMDHCREARRLDGAELAVFRTAASCVGSAIYQAQARRDRAAQERAKLLGSVAEAANLLLRSADFTEVLPEVTRLLGEAVGSDRCSVMQNVIHESSDNLGLQLLHEWANNGVEVLPGNSPDFFTEGLIPLEGSFLEFHETLLKGEVVNFLTENVSEGPKAFLEEQGIASILIVPIMVQGHCWGSIGFDNCGEPRLYDEAEIAILKVAAESIAAAIARQAQDKALRESEKAVLAEQERAAQERVAELAKTNEALSQTLNVLTTEPELERFLSTVLLQINQQIGADDAHLFFYDAEEHTLSQRIAVQSGKVFLPNAPDDPDIFCAPIPADITEAWRILTESSKPFILDDEHPQSAEFLWPGTQAWHQSRGHRAATCVCMKVGSEPLGFIGFAFCNQTILASEQLEFIQSLTNQATLAIHLTRLADQSKSAVLTEERNRLAREIHDTLAQAFTGISLQLEAAKDSFADADEEDALYHVGRAGHLARRGLSEARRSVRALRSQALVTDTLPNALRTALQEMTQASSLQAQFELVGDAYPLPEDIQTNLLRIGQEAATNTLRHAQADTLKLTLIFEPERVCMTICDDGKGSDVSLKSAEGFGLIGMRERVLRYQGEFDFTSTPGSGTVIQVAIPAPHEYRPAHSSLGG